MKPKRFSPLRSAIVATWTMLACIPAARAAGEVTSADLQATARSLGFLENLRRDGPLVIGIVYAPSGADARTAAGQAAERLASIPGPNGSTLRTIVIAADGLDQTSERLDAIFLMPGASTGGTPLSGVVRRRRLLSISTDPACIDQQCCVLMVCTGSGVEIVLQTALADVVGARFSTVFMMMVKRQ